MTAGCDKHERSDGSGQNPTHLRVPSVEQAQEMKSIMDAPDNACF